MDSDREIENLYYDYAYYLDTGDLEGVARLFADAVVYPPPAETYAPAGGKPAAGYEEALAMYSAVVLYPPSNTPRTQHVTTNVRIEVDESSGTASGRAYLACLQALEDFPLQPICTAVYHDKFKRLNGKWRFAERRMTLGLVGDMSRHLKGL